MNNFILRKITILDIKSIYNIYSNSELLRFTDSDVLKSKQEAVEKIEFFEKGYKNQTHFYFGISKNDTDEIIGIVGINDINKRHFFGLISAFLLPEYQQQGIMTDAINQFTKIVFTELNLHRIEAQIFEENYSSIALFKKLNFKYEGTLRQNFLIDGKFENAVVYSKLKSDI